MTRATIDTKTTVETMTRMTWRRESREHK